MLESEPLNSVDPDLERLHRWLSFQLLPSTLFGASFFGPAAFLLGLVRLAAICFGPVMLWSLFRLRRWGWIATFAVGIGGASLLETAPVGMVGTYLLQAAPLAFFYTFTWALKTATGNWLEKARGDSLLAYYDHRYAHESVLRDLGGEARIDEREFRPGMGTGLLKPGIRTRPPRTARRSDSGQSAPGLPQA